MRDHIESELSTPNNLSLYRLEGFSGCPGILTQLHGWLTSGDLPAMAISGEQGNGKSSIATAAAWNNIHHFSDGIIRVGPAGTSPFRMYDVVRTFDTVLGTTLTRVSEDRWGISILEQLYRRKRLLILDKLAGATERDLTALIDIIGHLHESGGKSRVLLIDRNFSPGIAGLVDNQHLHLEGLVKTEAAKLVQNRAPRSLAPLTQDQLDELYALTSGRPLLIRLLLGLMLDFSWDDLLFLMESLVQADGTVRVQDVVKFAVENYAIAEPQVGPLLNRLVSASGGASLAALRDLFWHGLGKRSELDLVVDELVQRALIELDPYNRRVVLHPVVRRYLEQNAILLGEDWDREHASYYLSYAKRYQELPQQRWPEIDVEWGNIYQAADWCTNRMRRIWEGEPFELLSSPELDLVPMEVPEVAIESLDDLRLARGYALALAYYAFWRHPLGILWWSSAGALASLALKDTNDYAWLQANIGRQLFFVGRIDEAIKWLERARDIFERQDVLSELAYVYTDLGTSTRILDQPRRAVTYFLAALDCIVQIDDPYSLTTAYMNLGSAYYSMENYERALNEHRKALRIAQRRNDDHSLASAFNNMGLALEGIDRLDEALQAYKNALAVFKRVDDETGISTCYNNLGSACYAQGDFGRALNWYELDLALSQIRGNWTDMAATLHNLGHVALEQRTYDKALSYFEQSRELYAAFDLTDYVNEEGEMISYIQSLDSESNGD